MVFGSKYLEILMMADLVLEIGCAPTFLLKKNLILSHFNPNLKTPTEDSRLRHGLNYCVFLYLHVYRYVKIC